MHRIEGTSVDRSSGVNLFKTTPPYTTLTPEWMNSVQEELMNIIIAAGYPVLSKDEDSRDQLSKILARKNKILQINGLNYSITDNDDYSEIWVTTGASDITITLPTAYDNLARKIKIIKVDVGVGNVIVNGEGSETINGTSTIIINKQYGWWEFTSNSVFWNGSTDGYSSIIEVSSEVVDLGLTVDGTWDDVNGMIITLTPGKWLISTKGEQYGEDTSTPKVIILGFGLGTLSGNNAPNIRKMDPCVQGIVNSMALVYFEQMIQEFEYSVTVNTTIYMKASITTDEMDATTHAMFGNTNKPMFIRARRIA